MIDSTVWYAGITNILAYSTNSHMMITFILVLHWKTHNFNKGIGQGEKQHHRHFKQRGKQKTGWYPK